MTMFGMPYKTQKQLCIFKKYSNQYNLLILLVIVIFGDLEAKDQNQERRKILCANISLNFYKFKIMLFFDFRIMYTELIMMNNWQQCTTIFSMTFVLSKFKKCTMSSKKKNKKENNCRYDAKCEHNFYNIATFRRAQKQLVLNSTCRKK